MNGMILQAPTENKDIKLSTKKGEDTKSEKGENLFENLIAQLIEEEGESKNSDFLLGKILNLSSDFTNKGKTLSEFSKGDLITDENGEEILLEDLFKVALSFKNDQSIEEMDTLPKELKVTLQDKDIATEFKEAKNIKELLNVADKHDIKVKNFQFFMSESALEPKDKQMVQKITSEEIFKISDTQKISKEPLTTQNILSKIITQESEKTKSGKTDTKESQVTLTSLLSKESQKETKVVKINQVPSSEVQKSLLTKTEEKTPQTQKTDLETELETFQSSKPEKAHKSRLSSLLNNDISTKENKLASQVTTKEEPLIKIEAESKESLSEKTTPTGDIKSEAIHKPKDNPDIKKTFNTFAMEFKEKVEAYKPPMMKINMQLSPKNLGDVDVTLVTRGNNLQVNINSNSNNTLALFIQNQAEFKNSLVNMGFSDLQMNFGDGRGEQRGQNKHKEQKQQGDYHDSLENEESEGINMIIPHYV